MSQGEEDENRTNELSAEELRSISGGSAGTQDAMRGDAPAPAPTITPTDIARFLANLIVTVIG
jgi:hypothetical protein